MVARMRMQMLKSLMSDLQTNDCSGGPSVHRFHRLQLLLLL
jgi:hypothetical protein